MLLVSMQILELFELIDYTFSAVDKPEYFVRINSESALKKISENSLYKSDTLATIFEMHQESVCYMKYFFTELKTDEERWEFIENYFLGNIKKNYNIPIDYNPKIKKIVDSKKETESLRYTQKNSSSEKILTVYYLMYNDDESDIINKFYVSFDEYVIDAKKLNPNSELGQKLPNC